MPTPSEVVFDYLAEVGLEKAAQELGCDKTQLSRVRSEERGLCLSKLDRIFIKAGSYTINSQIFMCYNLY